MAYDNMNELYKNVYELWMKQSKEFFKAADDNLKNIFDSDKAVNPQDHLQQINEWLEALKNQWEFTQLSTEQKAYAHYWKVMMQMCNEASELLIAEWTNRAKQDKPIKTVRDLYDLWLNCCDQVYQKAIHTKTYQNTFNEFMNAAFRCWKSYVPKE